MSRKRIRYPDGSTSLAEELSRRGFLSGAALGAAGLAIGTRDASGAVGKGPAEINIRKDGTYDTVPLSKDSVRLHVMQTRVRPVDASSSKSAEAGRKENVTHMLELLQNAQEWNPPGDIVFFHEFPITGFKFDWTRKDIDRVAIDLPGPEFEAIAAAAKLYGCYVVFGSYVRDKDWPGHVLSITTVVGPDGTIVDKHWKARNIMGVFRIGRQPIELMTTTIYNVLDRYIEMYGADAVIPVTRTPYGNICTSSVQREPELFRAMALKGAEILLRTATGGFTPADIEMCATYNRVYTAVCNNAVSPGNQFFEDAGSGGSAIYDEFGRQIASARSEHEQLVSAVIPIKQYRANHRQPQFAWDLYRPVLDQYVPRYPPSNFSTVGLPTDLQEAYRQLNDPKNVNW